jgi:glutamine amidotransferase
MTMIGIIDYGMGNLRSVEKAFERIGYDVKIVQTPRGIVNSDKLVLPGVGAFGQAMRNLHQMGLLEPIHESIHKGKPLLGICLGLQLLFEESEEHGLHKGLKVFGGRVRRLPTKVKVPHIGWNQIQIKQENSLLEGIPDGSFFYFVQSYYVEPRDERIVIATTDYGLELASIVSKDNVFGVQFHPEKSQNPGLRILKNFGGL